MPERGEERVPGDRFAVRELLGEGAVGRVYRVYDHVRRHELALKWLTALRPDSLYRFKQEFRALADFIHPNLVTLYELHASPEGEGWCVAMELVEGARSFLEYVRPYRHILTPADSLTGSSESELGASRTPSSDDRSAELETAALAQQLTQTSAQPPTLATTDVMSRQGGLRDTRRRAIEQAVLIPERLESALSQLIDGVAALHERGMLHRDLKPSNVLVDSRGRVVICDFGLIAPLHADERQFLGTPAYASPEQSAGASCLTTASDWYAVGVMLYEALTGRLPVQAPTIHELIALKSVAPVTPPRCVNRLVSDELDALTMALLDIEPARRPPAEHLRASVGVAPLAMPSRFRAAPDVPFVGRAAELERIRSAFADARANRAVTVLVGAPSGTGKSALVAHAVETLSHDTDAVVFAGRCYEGESVPFKALDAVIDAIAGFLRGAPELARRVVPEEIDALAHLFPTLRRAAAVAEALAGNELSAPAAAIRRRAAVALRTLLARLAQHRPVIVSIDDLQWGDADSAPLLVELAQAPESPGVLLLGTYRNDGAGDPALIAALRIQLGVVGANADVRLLELAPLGRHEVEGLVATLTGESAEAPLVQRLARESEGNPFFAAELAFARDSFATSFHGLDALLGHRAAELPDPARHLLQAAALAARPQPVDVLVAAARVVEVAQALAQLRVGRFLRVEQTREGERLTTYHDRIRETVVAAMTEPARKKLHRRLARAFERVPERDLEALVHHWRGAGSANRARGYALLAAERALHGQAFFSAANHLGAALELSPANDPERAHLEIARADALQRAGQLAAAAAAFRQAANDVDPATAADLRGRALVCLLRVGRLDEAMADAGAANHAVGTGLPRSTFAAVMAILRQRARLLGRRTDVRQLRLEAACSERELARLDLGMETALGLGFIDTLLGFALQSRVLADALEVGEPTRAAMAIAYEALFLAAMKGMTGKVKCEALFARATELATEHATPSFVAIIDGWRGYVKLLRYEELNVAAEAIESSIARAELESRFTYDVDQLRLALVNTWLHRGALSLLNTRLPALLRRAHENGNLYLYDSLRAQGGVYSWLAADEPAQALAQLDDVGPPVRGRPTLRQFYWHALHADIALYDGRLAAAWDHLSPFFRRMSRSSLASCVLPYAYTAQLVGRIALSLAIDRPAERKRWLRVAAWPARVLARLDRKLPYFALAHARAIRAEIALIRGQREPAVVLFADAVARFDSADANFYAMPLRARLGELLGGDEGAELIAIYHSWAQQEGVRAPSRFADWMMPPMSAVGRLGGGIERIHE